MARVYDSETTASDVVQDVADQINGKVVLTTGVSPGGLGAAFVESVAAAQPALLILAGRSLAKVRETADNITTQHPNVKVRLLELDLGSLAAVRQAAEAVLSWDDVPKIDVLVNNAGVMGLEYARSDAGVEMTLAINHLGPFLFTNLLMNKLLTADKPRVVMLGSEGHRWNPIRWGDISFRDGASYNKWQAYGQSKTANMLMALALAEKLGYGPKKLLAFCVHPGFAPTHLDAHIAGGFASELPVIHALDVFLGNVEGPVPFRSPQHCAANHVFAAFSPDLDGKQTHNGAYLTDCRVANPVTDTVKPWGTSTAEARRLWDLSEKLVGQKFVY
ncbi:hypothetical protein C7999DRAFT_18411 [Corynascus novoguineensis]|uniref:Short-chain dehydrogenase n=1 Tax=Corynascus novoguineensis TaxID=1126955 RepID=A0AAN7CJH5_9PEZI|nr:hypothetical protein C7999DRAFT_18411 [Corynascus novoguineensis]